MVGAAARKRAYHIVRRLYTSADFALGRNPGASWVLLYQGQGWDTHSEAGIAHRMAGLVHEETYAFVDQALLVGPYSLLEMNYGPSLEQRIAVLGNVGMAGHRGIA